MEDLVLSCLESRVEENRNLYARFLVGPFLKGDALTVATALRRVLLSSRESIGITALYIQGITHEFSTIAGVRESVLELSLNFGAIVLSYDKTFFGKKNFFDEIQIGYLQAQGPKIVYANDLKLPLGVKLVDPTQYIATISKEGSIVLKFVIGKRNDLLNQKTSFHNSESDFGKQSIYFSALGELVKKNITRAKKIYPSKGCSFYLTYKQKQIGADRSDSRQIVPKNCTRTNLLINLRFFSKHNLRSFVQTKHSKSEQFKFVTEKRHFFERSKFTKLHNAYTSLGRKICKGASNQNGLKGSQKPKSFARGCNFSCNPILCIGGTFRSRKTMCKQTKLALFCAAKATKVLETISKSHSFSKNVYKSLTAKKLTFSPAKLYKAPLCFCNGKPELREKQTFQNRFGVMLIQTSRIKFLTSLHNLMQTKSPISSVCTSIKQPSLNPFKASINDKSLSNVLNTSVPFASFTKGDQKRASSSKSLPFVSKQSLLTKVHGASGFATKICNSFQRKQNLASSACLEKGFKSNVGLRNIIPLDLTLTPVLKVNFVIEIDDEVLYLRQKIRERIVIEVWTNGSIHPRQAVHDAALSLTDMFGSFRSVYQAKSYSFLNPKGFEHLRCKGAKLSPLGLRLSFAPTKPAKPGCNPFYTLQSSYKYKAAHIKRSFVSKKFCKTLDPQKDKWLRYQELTKSPTGFAPTPKGVSFDLSRKDVSFAISRKGLTFAPFVSKHSLLSFAEQKQRRCSKSVKPAKLVKPAKPTKSFLSNKKRNNNFIYQSNLEKNSLFFSDLGELSLPENLYCFLKKKGIENLSTLKAFSSFELLLLVNGNRDMFCTLKRFLLKYNFSVANF